MTAATAQPILEVRHVSKRYRAARPLFRDVTFDVQAGEFVYVTGPSGSGKSTLLRMIYRAEAADTGTIQFCGKDVLALAPRAVPFLRRNVGVILQDFKLIGEESVYDNVALALEILGLPQREIYDRVRQALDRVGLAGYEDIPAADLSGGEQQRVAVARAVVTRPSLVLADEPTGNLDAGNAAMVVDLLEEVNAEGTTVLLATHDNMLIAARPHRTVALVEGSVDEIKEARAVEDVRYGAMTQEAFQS
ncbi:MAG: ATP-binding cassette domain-containing protein [Deltaproteobacteria bacterium]|nr:ATP-binding cassette domain-containing protein [Deltaproteobacteria bacterium]